MAFNKNVTQSSDLATKQNGMDSDFYPLCWQDDERMENLFAPFRDKSVNPVNYETKMKFWKNLIQEYCKNQGNPTVSLGQLRMAFQRKEKRPYCIDTVLDELIVEGLAKTKQQFLEAPLLTWSGWVVHKLVKAPLRWSFDKVKERVVSAATNGNSDENTEYVLIEVAKVNVLTKYTIQFYTYLNLLFQIFPGFQAIAEKLLISFNGANECHTIVSKDDLIKQLTENTAFNVQGKNAKFPPWMNRLSEFFISKDLPLLGIECALHYLHCHHKLSIQKTTIDKQEITLYKFAVAWNCTVEPITLLDVSIFTLNKMEKSLTKSVEAIEMDINSTDALVRQYIRDKKKHLAKNFLRKKHVLEKNMG